MADNNNIDKPPEAFITKKELPKFEKPNVVEVLAVSPPVKSIAKNKEKITKIRDLYFVKKWTEKEIAQVLKMKPKTIQKAVAKLKMWGREFADKNRAYNNDMLNFFFEIVESYKKRIKKLWNIFNTADYPQLKVSTLKEIREQEKQHIEILQSVGLMPKAADKTLQSIVYISNLGKEENKQKEEEKKDVTEQPKQIAQSSQAVH